MFLLSSGISGFKGHDIRVLCLGVVFGRFDGVWELCASPVGQDIESVVYDRRECHLEEPHLNILGLLRHPGS